MYYTDQNTLVRTVLPDVVSRSCGCSLKGLQRWYCVLCDKVAVEGELWRVWAATFSMLWVVGVDAKNPKRGIVMTTLNHVKGYVCETKLGSVLFPSFLIYFLLTYPIKKKKKKNDRSWYFPTLSPKWVVRGTRTEPSIAVVMDSGPVPLDEFRVSRSGITMGTLTWSSHLRLTNMRNINYTRHTENAFSNCANLTLGSDKDWSLWWKTLSGGPSK